jgi:hypothetical protein
LVYLDSLLGVTVASFLEQAFGCWRQDPTAELAATLTPRSQAGPMTWASWKCHAGRSEPDWS